MIATRFHNLLRTALAAVLVVMALAVVAGGVSSPAIAEKKLTKEEKEARLKYKNKATRQRKSVGASCAKKLTKVGELTEVEDWVSAEKELEEASRRACTSSYEKSQLYRFQGYVYYATDRVQDAIRVYVAMINEPDADQKQRIDTRYTVAQLYYMQEKYVDAVRELEIWIKEAAIVDRSGRVLLAKGYYQLDRKDEALDLVEDVIAETLRSELVPKESWLTFNWAILYEKEEYKKTLKVSHLLLTHFAKIKYWKQLSAMHGAVGNDEREMLALELTYMQEGLDKEKQFLAMAYQFLAFDMPYQAAQVLEKALASGDVERTEKNLSTLGSSYQRAQEFKKASPILEEAAKLSKDGNTYSRLASVYLNLNENEKALKAVRNALKKGKLKREDLAWMNRGNAEQALHCYDDAVKSFTKAQKFEKTRKSAANWKKYVAREGKRRAKLIANGAKLDSCKKV